MIGRHTEESMMIMIMLNRFDTTDRQTDRQYCYINISRVSNCCADAR